MISSCFSKHFHKNNKTHKAKPVIFSFYISALQKRVLALMSVGLSSQPSGLRVWKSPTRPPAGAELRCCFSKQTEGKLLLLPLWALGNITATITSAWWRGLSEEILLWLVYWMKNAEGGMKARMVRCHKKSFNKPWLHILAVKDVSEVAVNSWLRGLVPHWWMCTYAVVWRAPS